MNYLLVPDFYTNLQYQEKENLDIYTFSDVLLETATHFDELAIKFFHDISSAPKNYDVIIGHGSGGLILLLAASLFPINAALVTINTQLSAPETHGRDMPFTQAFKDVLQSPGLKEFMNPEIGLTHFSSTTDKSIRECFSSVDYKTFETSILTLINEIAI